MYIKEFFALNANAQAKLYSMKPEFGYNGFGETIFFRTYSRLKNDGRQESWADCILRVVNGVMSIRKDWYVRNFIEWNEETWQEFASELAFSMFRMHWLPPGRGLWAMGTSFVFERGSMALNNCGYVTLRGNDTLANELDWIMDALMLGVGVGFGIVQSDLKVFLPIGTYVYQIPDSREGWCNSIRLLVSSYVRRATRKPIFDYSLIRPKGQLIRSFGGKASGPEPLIKLHKQIEDWFVAFSKEFLSETELKANIANAIGCCVVAGNVRRSAELALASINDKVFLDLKDYKKNPHRAEYGWMSNNTTLLDRDLDFECLADIAQRVIVNGEPGIANKRNFKKGRVGHKKDKTQRKDNAIGLNPCGEITLEDYELCNLAKTFPTRCPTILHWYKALRYATFYASTTALLPTHRPETNLVVSRNRRIGVDFADYSGWINTAGLNKVIKYMRSGYDVVCRTNRELAAGAGVPESIKKTTITPGGTIPKLAGKTPGIGYATFNFTLRRFRIASNHSICEILDSAGIPSEPCINDPKGTKIYEFPIHQSGVPATDVTLWEQAFNLITVQREWADNAVSNTLFFKPKWVLIKKTSDIYDLQNSIVIVDNGDIKEINKLNEGDSFQKRNFKVTFEYDQYSLYKFNERNEEDEIEKVLAALAPLIKSASLLPHTEKGVYPQVPEEGISEDEYNSRLRDIKFPIDWNKFINAGQSDGQDEKFCVGDFCELTK